MPKREHQPPSIGSLSNLKKGAASFASRIRNLSRSDVMNAGTRVALFGAVTLLGAKSVEPINADQEPSRSDRDGVGVRGPAIPGSDTPTPIARPRGMPGDEWRLRRGDDWPMERSRPYAPKTETRTSTATSTATRTATETVTAPAKLPATATVTRTATAIAIIRTETRTATATPESKSAPWPPITAYILTQIRVVNGLSYIRTSDPSKVASTGGSYDPNTRIIFYLTEGALYEERYTASHEAFHANQHQDLIDAQFSSPGWLAQWATETPRGRAFVAMADEVNNAHLTQGSPLPWDGFGSNPLEDYPNIGMIWYTGYYPRSWFNDFPPLLQFSIDNFPENSLATPTALPNQSAM